VFSAIDSGTTVSISADGKLLMHGFHPKAAVKIVGFNGSISKSEEVATSLGLHILLMGGLVMGCKFLSAFSEFIRYRGAERLAVR